MRSLAASIILLLLISIFTPLQVIQAEEGSPTSVIINEIYVSPSSEQYGGVDWNGDGEIGRYSNQFVEIFNPTSTAIDLGGFWIDDAANAGSPACSIGWDTIIQPGAYVTFFRWNTQIEFDFWDGDSITIYDSSMSVLDSVTYPGEDSDYGIPYGYDANGSWGKIADGPTPGGANDQPWVGINHLQGTCYPVRDHIHSGSYILQGKVVTMIAENSVIEDGQVLVTNGIIEAVWSSDDLTPNIAAGVEIIIETSGVIYPGLIDIHNHPHYNFIPLWDHGTNGWDNRYEWRTEDYYKDSITIVENGVNDGGSDGCDLISEAMKFAEVRSISGGTTAIQGSTSQDTATFDSILARNIEQYNFGKDRIETRVGGSWFPDDYSGSHIKSALADDDLDAWLVHLAEGIDEPSRAEFDALINNDLIIDELVIIHGTALTSNEFEIMASVGASLVWSPMSNLLLYGDTADIAAAKAAGVSISVAPDWAPSGAKNVLHEIKVADWWDTNVLGNIFTDFEMVQMISTNPVDEVNWTNQVGRIQPGLAADLLILDSFEVDPYRNLLNSVDSDVRLVVVGGMPIWGDVDVMQALVEDAEIVQAPGYTKAVDVTYAGIEGGEKTLASMIANIENCMSNLATPAVMEKWYTLGDDRYFDVLNRSATFQQGRTIDLFGDYYDIQLNDDGHRIGGSVSGAEPIDPGSGEGTGTVIEPPVLPIIWETYGPRGGSLPHPTTIEEGIHFEICETDRQILSDNDVPLVPIEKELLCGSILVVMQPTEECIDSSGSYCNLDVGDALAVPSHLCDDAGTFPIQVTCKAAWSFSDIDDGTNNPEPEPEPEPSSWMNGPFYYVAFLIAGMILIGSLTIVYNNLNREE